ncbi:hypothetical protein [Neorhizobium sp. JUb45]|uniref:hypothetical protein n=1 Tax=Neorhizobium sp. JUb45 TaxID=2485113 RepID=UPI0010515947|nr:hypothetical protein [Neorhizobium sp. JUb45]TCR01083.1 hypothetical protein EDF70_10588 [Neorhizobium sp. JUb45]
MSEPIDREKEKRKLDKLRQIADRMAGDAWSIWSDEDGMHVVTVRATGEEVRILTLHPEATCDEQDLVAGALDHLFLFLGFFGRAAERVRELREQVANLAGRKKAENFGFMAKSLCEKIPFWRFLEGKAGGSAIASERAADTRMKFLLNIESKGQLNDDLEARARFLKLRADYYAWKKGVAA